MAATTLSFRSFPLNLKMLIPKIKPNKAKWEPWQRDQIWRDFKILKFFGILNDLSSICQNF